MYERTLSESPLVRFDPRADETGVDDRAVVLSERPLLGHVNLRGDLEDGRFTAAVEAAIGVELPVVSNVVVEGQGNTVYWLGPNEWLIVTSREHEATIANELRKALGGVFSAVAEVSGGQTVLVLRGRAVREVLARGCPLDLHPRVFGPGRCAQSHLAKAPILLRQRDAEPTFEIVVRRSFADYLWRWLEDAKLDHEAGVTHRHDGDRCTTGVAGATQAP